MWIVERGKDPEFAELIDPNTTALVVIDVQNDFCHGVGAYGQTDQSTDAMPGVALAIRKLLTAARAREVLTVFVRATYDPEVTSRALANNRRRRGLVRSLCLEGTWGAEWYGGVEPAGSPNEVVLTKHRFDAFKGTPLDIYLRNSGIRTVIVTGVATSGCVESTVRDAFFHDYMVAIPADAVAEPGQLYHEASLKTLKRAFATITDADAIVAEWTRSGVPIAPGWRPEARRARAEADRSAEGLVLVDVESLGTPQAALARAMADAARAAGVPIFDVRTVDVPLGRTAGDDHLEAVGGESYTGASSPTEMRVDKQRRSGFAGTRLGLLLRTNLVRHVTIAGAELLPSSVTATVLDALDADYQATLVSDACADIDVMELERAGARLAHAAGVIERWRARSAGAAAAEPTLTTAK